MKILIDVDNTFFDYSDLYEKSLQLENLNIESFHSKEELKNKVKDSYGNKGWIRFQGTLYGKCISEIKINKLSQEIVTNNSEVILISHKSKKSLCGRYDLRHECDKVLKKLQIENKILYFETKEDKINFINNNADIIIDDLDSIIKEVNENILAIHFEDHNQNFSTKNWTTIKLIIELIKNLDSNLKYKTLSKSTLNLRSQNFNYTLKINRNRKKFENEKYIYDLLENSTLIPKIIQKNPSYILMETVTGSKPTFKKALTANRNLINILRQKQFNNKSGHHITNSNDYLKNINSRIKELNLDNSIISKLLSTNELKDVNPIIDITNPDFHIDNTIDNGDRVICFDFESISLDDPARSLLNFLLHPKNEEIDIDTVINYYKMTYPNDKDLVKRAYKVFKVIAIEWVLIRYSYNKDIDIDKELSCYNRNPYRNEWEETVYERLSKEM